MSTTKEVIAACNELHGILMEITTLEPDDLTFSKKAHLALLLIENVALAYIHPLKCQKLLRCLAILKESIKDKKITLDSLLQQNPEDWEETIQHIAMIMDKNHQLQRTAIAIKRKYENGSRHPATLKYIEGLHHPKDAQIIEEEIRIENARHEAKIEQIAQNTQHIDAYHQEKIATITQMMAAADEWLEEALLTLKTRSEREGVRYREQTRIQTKNTETLRRAHRAELSSISGLKRTRQRQYLKIHESFIIDRITYDRQYQAQKKDLMLSSSSETTRYSDTLAKLNKRNEELITISQEKILHEQVLNLFETTEITQEQNYLSDKETLQQLLVKIQEKQTSPPITHAFTLSVQPAPISSSPSQSMRRRPRAQ